MSPGGSCFSEIVFQGRGSRRMAPKPSNQYPLQNNDDLVPSASNNKPRSRSIASIRYETYGEVYGGYGLTNNCNLIPVIVHIYLAACTFPFFPLHVMFYSVLTCLFMCKSPDILRHSRSCFLTTPNLYVQIRELGTRRLSL